MLPLILLVVMPLVVIPFVKPAFRVILLAEGVEGANGAEQAIPGMQVMFGFFLASQVSLGFYSEHAWATWSRLRASPAGTGGILLGKILTPLLIAAMQFIVLFGLGGLLLRLHVHGSWVLLCVVATAFSLCVIALGLAVTAVCTSIIQVNAITSVSALLASGLGGALVPMSLLPAWARMISPVVPSYWAMKGYRDVILGGDGGWLVPVLALLAFAAAFALVAGWRLRFSDPKTGFA
jgi:ABC-2 type transport system permease protein